MYWNKNIFIFLMLFNAFFLKKIDYFLFSAYVKMMLPKNTTKGKVLLSFGEIPIRFISDDITFGWLNSICAGCKMRFENIFFWKIDFIFEKLFFYMITRYFGHVFPTRNSVFFRLLCSTQSYRIKKRKIEIVLLK